MDAYRCLEAGGWSQAELIRHWVPVHACDARTVMKDWEYTGSWFPVRSWPEKTVLRDSRSRLINRLGFSVTSDVSVSQMMAICRVRANHSVWSIPWFG